MSKNLITIKPLGGVGEIGANMFLLTTPDAVILIDAGMLFPREDFWGIDFLLPDLSSIEKIDYLIITHAHEDHIGAIHIVIKKFPKIKIYAPLFAQSLIRRKLDEKKINCMISAYDENREINIDKTIIKPIRVNHSIPDSFGLFVYNQKKSFSLFYISDFKTDSADYFGKQFKIEDISAFASKFKLRILLADSTNILMDKSGPTEQEIVENLEKIFKKAPGRIFITAFPSNIARVKTILTIAKKLNKKVVPHGRSVLNSIEMAKELGLIEDFNNVLNSEAIIDPLANNLVVFASGSQGDFRGAVKRITSGNDSKFTLIPDDTFIFSSRTIPGNESRVNAIIDEVCLANCHLFTAEEHAIHSSGHPSKEELRMLYLAFKPTHAIPVHGTHYFIKRHLEFIKELKSVKLNITPINLLPFDELAINDKLELEIVKNVSPKLTMIHGKDLEIESTAISQKRKMAETGLISLSINEGKFKKGITDFYKIKAVGLPEMFDEYLNDVGEIIQSVKKQSDKNSSVENLEEQVRIAIRKFADNILGYKPVTIVQIK